MAAISPAFVNYCKVQGCRFSSTHTTSGHKCSKCDDYSHGVTECGIPERIELLCPYLSDVLPDELKCKVGGCDKSQFHTTDGHHCSYCSGRFHSITTCVRRIDMDIVCPICKARNSLKLTQSKLFGVENLCVVCTESPVDVFLPSCGHACLCFDCAEVLSGTRKIYDGAKSSYNSKTEAELRAENYPIDKIKQMLKIYPSFVTVYEGMGCYTMIRRLREFDNVFGLFVHADDGYASASEYGYASASGYGHASASGYGHASASEYGHGPNQISEKEQINQDFCKGYVCVGSLVGKNI